MTQTAAADAAIAEEVKDLAMYCARIARLAQRAPYAEVYRMAPARVRGESMGRVINLQTTQDGVFCIWFIDPGWGYPGKRECCFQRMLIPDDVDGLQELYVPERGMVVVFANSAVKA